MRENIMGIDPGKHGGICEIYSDGRITFDILRDPHTTFERLREFKFHQNAFVYVEKAQCMPGNGLVSMFNYGVHAGQLEGFLIALQIPYELVPPIVWTKEMHAGTNQKDRAKDKSRQVAKRLFPGLDISNPDNPRSTTAHEGILDALLIAEFGRRRRH